MTGIINVYKEKGYTSHDVVAIMRRIAGTKKVGHTGTLDPDATGVLPICIGRATKLAEHLAAQDKTYIAQIILGIETNTGDISGEIMAKKPVTFDEAAIAQTVKSFLYSERGEYLQVPPMYSAIKIGGKKLYELARKGETIDRPPRPVAIHDIAVLDYTPAENAFTIRVKCSKGTYIRSLATDIGAALGCGATMGELTRTQSGAFSIDTATKLDALKAAGERGELAPFVLPVDALLPYPKITIAGEDLARALNGNPLPIALANGADSPKFWVYSHTGELIGLYANDGKKLRVEVLMWTL
ncbi:MAG: tRNA pseudouridine(55) synthase TruB [Defluviitaleaceae bacterium]|nr:tRNA pseudouridine(55) synthase TruB [Defluviitaleaceae bacterium]